MKQYSFGLSTTYEAFNVIGDGDAFVLSFSTLLINYASRIDISLCIEKTVTFKMEVQDDKVNFCDYQDRQIKLCHISGYRREPRITIALVKAAGEMFDISVNGDSVATIKQYALKSGRVDSVAFHGASRTFTVGNWLQPHFLAVLDVAVIEDEHHGKYPGYPKALAEDHVRTLRNFPAFQKSIADREKALRDKEKELADREEAVNKKGGGSTNSDGSDNISHDVRPPDYDDIKLLSTVAWPRAIKPILGATLDATIRKKHDDLMNEWVTARGDNLSTLAYDMISSIRMELPGRRQFWRIPRM